MIALAATIWFAAACLISLVVGAAIRLADRREQPEPVAVAVAA